MEVQCELCPKLCIIEPGQSGECRIRVNLDGALIATTYAYPCSVHVDPVEKKPLFHFLPGTGILSIATVGCNLHCLNCQNWEISQENPENVTAQYLPPEDIPGMAKRYGCLSVAYTYTDPAVYYEYACDSCVAVREAGLKNVMVSAGYINEGPLKKLYAHVDAANIDLKGITEKFYREICDATLKPVQNALVAAKSMGVEVEVTNLLIPTLNDSDEDLTKLCRWMAQNMGVETPLHFSRFFPQHKMKNLPPTPAETLKRAREIALSEGLQFVYIGNILVEGAETTSCPKCGMKLIDRRGFEVIYSKLKDGACPRCKTKIYGRWL